MVSIFKTSKFQKSAMFGTGIVRPNLGFWLLFTYNGYFRDVFESQILLIVLLSLSFFLPCRPF